MKDDSVPPYADADLFAPSLSALDDRPGTTPLAWHRKPWNRYSLQVSTVAFGFLVGALLVARNDELLGDRRAGRRTLVATAVASLLVMALCFTTWRLGLFFLVMPLNPLSAILIWVLSMRQPKRLRTFELPTFAGIGMIILGFLWLMASISLVLGPAEH